MKKVIGFLLTVCATGFTALAQTQFRPLPLDEALKTAEQENKMVFVDFYTDWCGPCKMMARDIFPQKEVGDYLNTRFVCVKLNAEKEGKEQATRYAVKAYPTFLVLDTAGKVLLDIKGAMDAERFIGKITDGLNPEMSPERIAQRYQSGERTPDLVNRHAQHLMEQGKEKEGMQVIDSYFASLTDSQRLAAENTFLYTRYTYDLNDEKGRFMVARWNDFPRPAKEAISARINRLFHSEVSRYFSGYMYREGKFKTEEFEALKKQIIGIGLDKKYAYAPMFRLIEGRVTTDDPTFWTMCKAEYDNLDPNDRSLLIMNLTRLITTDNQEVLKDVSKFVRNRLSDMSPNTIMMAERILDNIESKIK